MKGRKALISGGASGIGRAIAAKLAQEEVVTAVADIDLTGEMPPGLQAYQCNVAAGADVAALFADVQTNLGSPDILICSAGRGIHEKLTEGDPEKWKAVLDTNLLGALRMIRAFVPGMLAAGFGDVVLLSSVSAGQAYTYGGVYAATKAALETIAETLRLEVLPTVRVTVIAPGVTDTAFFENTISGFYTAADIGYGAMSPETVADAVLYALRQPEGVSVNRITLRPVAQPF